MYRAFLVYASAAERERIRTDPVWRSSGFSLVGEAGDGETALPMIRDLRPGLLIAGAQLPFMNGFELARAVRSLFPWTQVVLLGADDNLSRRRTLPDARIVEYLLEPVRGPELGEALARAADRMDRISRSLRESVRRADRNVSHARRTREQQISQWLETGVMPPTKPWKSYALYSRILTISSPSGQAEAMARGVLRLLEEWYPDSLRALDLEGGPMLAAFGNDLAQLEDLAYRVAYTALCAVERFAGEQVRIQIGQTVTNPEELRRSWLALHELANRQTSDRPILGLGDAIDPAVPTRPGLDATVVRAALERCARSCSLSPADMARAAESIIANNPFRAGLCSGGDVRWKPLIRSRQYIADHYDSPGLPLHGAAREAGMSVHRFCVVFEQEMRVSFTDYLYQMRVNVAKALLSTTRMRINSIARAVGFAEPDYFIYIFQRYTGLPPREYRRAQTAKP